MLIAVAVVMFLAASCTHSTLEEECGDEGSCAPVLLVPDVEHRELREAYRKLVHSGFLVSFDLERANLYYKYSTTRSIGIDPEPWVGDINPEPGSEVDANATISITEIECPEQQATCD